jgi:hypothetical protein
LPSKNFKIEWLPNYFMKKIPKKIPKSCLKFVFLTSSRKGTIVTLLKKNLNAMIRNIKIHNILNIIENSKSMEPNKCTH